MLVVLLFKVGHISAIVWEIAADINLRFSKDQSIQAMQRTGVHDVRQCRERNIVPCIISKFQL